MMTRRQRLLIAVLTWVPALVILGWGTSRFISEVGDLQLRAATIIRSELSHRLGKDVRIGRARIGLGGRTVIEGLSVTDPASGEKESILSARRIVVYYDLPAVLRGAGAGAVRRADVSGLRVRLVRRGDGSFNVQDLLKPGPPGPPFTGEVRVTDGAVTFVDYLARTKSLPAVNRLREVTARVDAGRRPVYEFTGRGLGPPGTLRSIEAAGSYDFRSRTIALDFVADGASASYWSRYLGFWPDLSIRQGMLRAVVGLRYRRPVGIVKGSVFGSARLSRVDASVRGLGLSTSNVNGVVVLNGDSALLNLTGMTLGSPARVSGAVVGLRRPRLDLMIAAPAIDFGSLTSHIRMPPSLRSVHLSGRGPVRARITGLPGHPAMRLSARIPSARVLGRAASNIDLNAAYSSGLVSIRSLALRSEGATLTASGTVRIRPEVRLAVSGSARGVELARLPSPGGVKLSGTADADFSVRGPLSAPTVLLSGVAARGRANGVGFGGAVAVARIDPSGITLHRFELADIAGGTLSARGRIAPRALDIAVSVEGADLSSLSVASGDEGPESGAPLEIKGTVFFRGRLSGRPVQPTVAGVLEVFKGGFRGYEADYARIVFNGDRRSIAIRQAVVKLFPADISFSGRADGFGSERITIAGRVGVQRLTVDQLMKITGRGIDAEGIVLGEFDVRAAYLPVERRVADLRASGSLRLEDGAVFGYPITSASADLILENDTLTVSNASVKSQEAELAIDGVFSTKARTVDVTFKLSGVDLSRIRKTPVKVGNLDVAGLRERIARYARFSGILAASGAITGFIDRPNLTLQGNIDRFFVNDNSFDEAGFSVAYSGGVITDADARLARGAQVVIFRSRNLDPGSRCVESAEVKVSRAEVADIREIVLGSPLLRSEEGAPLRANIEKMPRLTSGVIDAEIAISGCVGKLNGSLSLAASDLGIDIQKIESISLRMTAKQGAVKLDEMTMISGDMNLTASGDPLYKDGLLRLDLSASNMELSRLRPWLGENTPGGVAAADLVIRGAAKSPDVIGSIEVINPSFRGLAFDRLRVSNISIGAASVEFSDVILAVGSHQAVAQGVIPWDWSTLSVPPDEPIAFSAGLKKQDLSLISSFFAMVDPAATAGTVEAGLDMTGTIANPSLKGALKVQDGVIALKGFTNLFQNLNVDLTFDGDRVIVNEASASSNAGGVVRILPGGYLSLGVPESREVNMLLSAEGLVVGERNLLGFQEDVVMRLDAGLSATGSLTSPLIADADVGGSSAGVSISDARLIFAVPEKPAATQLPSFPIDPTFGVGIRLGRDVYVAPPNTSLLVEGGGLLAGTLSRPDLSMQLAISEGSIRLASTRLQVTDGGTIYVRYAPPDPPESRLNFQARTSVLAMGPLRRRGRYQITMGVRGPVGNMQIDLNSSPSGLSREQMLAALGHVEGIFTSGETGLQQELGTILSAVGTSTIVAPLESIFTERLGFEQFTLEYSLRTPLSLFVSRRLFGNLYLSYFQQLSTASDAIYSPGYEIRLGYRFKGNYDLSLGVDQQDTFTAEVGFTQLFR